MALEKGKGQGQRKRPHTTSTQPLSLRLEHAAMHTEVLLPCGHLPCAIAAPVSRCHLRGVPEHSVGVSQKDYQAPIGILTSCEIRCLHAQTWRRVKLDPGTPTPATDPLPDMPVGSLGVKGKDFQTPIGIGSHNGISTQRNIWWVS